MKTRKFIAVLAAILAMTLTLGVFASAAERISKEQAIAVALNEVNNVEGLNLTEKDIRRIQADYESDDGVQYWEVTFRYGNIQYEVDINATTGAVIKYDTDRVFFYGFAQFWIKLWNLLFGWLS